MAIVNICDIMPPLIWKQCRVHPKGFHTSWVPAEQLTSSLAPKQFNHAALPDFPNVTGPNVLNSDCEMSHFVRLS